MLNIILQIAIVLFPQAVLGIVFCLLLTNKFDLVTFDMFGKIELNNKALLRLAVPSFNFSFLAIVLRQLRFDLALVPIVMIISTFSIMVIVYRINKLADAFKLLFSFCLWAVVMGVVEVITTPIIINIKGITVYDVFDSFYINFMSSIPCVVIMFFLDMFLFSRKKNILNISVIKSIVQSKFLTCATVIMFLFNFAHVGVYTVILNDKLLDVYPAKLQIIINAILMTFPALNLGGLWFLLYSVKYKEAMDMRIERDNMIREISVAKERGRLARDVHDTLGHSLTLIIKLLEVCKITYKINTDMVNEKLEEAIKIAQDGVQKVKLSVSGILDEKILKQDLFSALIELATEFENNSGIKVDITTQGVIEDVGKKQAAALYRICQEALTNSLRHGKAKNVAIIIRFDGKGIKLSIFDDGAGCGKINKGFGLKGMEQRIEEVNGEMSYKSDKGQGFILNFEVPKEDIA